MWADNSSSKPFQAPQNPFSRPAFCLSPRFCPILLFMSAGFTVMPGPHDPTPGMQRATSGWDSWGWWNPHQLNNRSVVWLWPELCCSCGGRLPPSSCFSGFIQLEGHGVGVRETRAKHARDPPSSAPPPPSKLPCLQHCKPALSKARGVPRHGSKGPSQDRFPVGLFSPMAIAGSPLTANLLCCTLPNSIHLAVV